MKILLIGLGGFTGAVARYYVSQGGALNLFGSKFPYGTMIVNVLGSFLLGALFVYSFEKIVISENMRLLLAVGGFLGAFTTFSTFSVEALTLFRSGAMLSAFLYIMGGNFALGLSAAFLGLLVARSI